jgi:hypothetical protein
MLYASTTMDMHIRGDIEPGQIRVRAFRTGEVGSMPMPSYGSLGVDALSGGLTVFVENAKQAAELAQGFATLAAQLGLIESAEAAAALIETAAETSDV